MIHDAKRSPKETRLVCVHIITQNRFTDVESLYAPCDYSRGLAALRSRQARSPERLRHWTSAVFAATLKEPQHIPFCARGPEPAACKKRFCTVFGLIGSLSHCLLLDAVHRKPLGRSLLRIFRSENVSASEAYDSESKSSSSLRPHSRTIPGETNAFPRLPPE